jgi:GntR family transcriptional repressor for pyruvate dehydrogenase complex
MYIPVKIRTKIPDLIFQQIRESILNGDMKPGDRLPPERELVKQFQASRIAIREALKSLEVSGLISIRPGSGMFVNEASSKAMSDSLSAFLRVQNTSIIELTKARLVFEPAIATLASEKATAEDIGKLEQNIHEASLCSEAALLSKYNIEFHSLVAQATHNTIISITMETLYNVLKEMTVGRGASIEKRLANSRRAVGYHRKVLHAFQERNHYEAHELIRRHIIEVQKFFEETVE